MRAPKNEATGTSGESEVLAQFERLGWGGVIDSGTTQAPICICGREMPAGTNSAP